MTDPDGWLERYGRSHNDLAIPALFWAGLLAVLLGTTGLLWSLPVPSRFFSISPFLNWGSVFLMAATVYYFIISLSIAIALLPFIVAIAAFQLWLGNSGMPPATVSAALLAAGVVGLGAGSRRRSPLQLLEDLQLMMIGPAWLLSVLFRRLGIPY